MDELQSAIKLRNLATFVFLTALLTGCAPNAAGYLSNSSMRMAHHTTILNHQTHRSVDAPSKNSSNVNFEYEEISTQ